MTFLKLSLRSNLTTDWRCGGLVVGLLRTETSAARKCKDPIGRWSKRVECWDMGLFSNIIWWFSTFQRAGLFCKESHGQAAQATCWQSGNLTDPPTALLFRHQENLYCVKSCDSRLVRCVMYCKILLTLMQGQLMSITGFVAHLRSHFAPAIGY